MPTPRTTAGFKASSVDKRDRIRRARFDAGGEVLGVERDSQLGALVRGIELLRRVADVLGDGRETQRVAAHLQAHRRGILRQDLDATDRLEQRLAFDRECVGMARRDQLPVVGELAFDQPCRQPSVADFECRVAITEAHREFFAASDQSLQLVERPTRHEHLLVCSEHLMIGEVADREAIRVGGDHSQPVVLGGQQHTGEDRPCLVGARGAHHLAQRLAERRPPAT